MGYCWQQHDLKTPHRQKRLSNSQPLMWKDFKWVLLGWTGALTIGVLFWRAVYIFWLRGLIF